MVVQSQEWLEEEISNDWLQEFGRQDARLPFIAIAVPLG